MVNGLLERLGLSLVNLERLAELQRFESEARLWYLLQDLDPQSETEWLGLLEKSKSQFLQDIFVLRETERKTGGFFVEFGATNGVDLSNSHLLEKEFGWKGILAEPCRGWHRDLEANRNSVIDKRCVWRASGERLAFVEADYAELSSIESEQGKDAHQSNRGGGKRYDVETISLIDLLDGHNAPKVIDYLSVDTEGSEFEILNAFDFSRYHVSIITVEHNFTEAREKIETLLIAAGFRRKFTRISACDDWYVNTTTIPSELLD